MSGDDYQVKINGLSSLHDFAEIPADVARAALRAVNKTIDRARASASREIRDQVAFPASYLTDANGRLSVTKRATGDDLEAIVTGRERPTSLARFLVGAPKVGIGQKGVRVRVQPGLATFLPRAFLIRLRSGSDTETISNLGLAIRLKPGQVPSAAYKPTRLADGLWLLYGPSIGQTFRTVSEDIAPDTALFLEDEFLRLLKVDLPE